MTKTLQHNLNDHAYQTLDKAEAALFDRLYKAKVRSEGPALDEVGIDSLEGQRRRVQRRASRAGVLQSEPREEVPITDRPGGSSRGGQE